MPDDVRIRLAVMSLLCLLPAASVIVAIAHGRRRGRRARSTATRGFGVILKR